ncbi:MraW methylase family-domain-containing protein [Jimgerdemannia flammicorona]|uniref:MraW methylase family-domain-containing protein n=1 Tax=Jimgerdemannia flammicorona TaxID=994334 RepID=A0A433QKD4_9FUNG|nr:MraW methylase family-domain-containing protein [Jimgerdemannia flammicorona]
MSKFCALRGLATSSRPYTAVHIPVLLREALQLLQPRSGETYCDATFGDGGYTKALLGACVGPRQPLPRLEDSGCKLTTQHRAVTVRSLPLTRTLWLLKKPGVWSIREATGNERQLLRYHWECIYAHSVGMGRLFPILGRFGHASRLVKEHLKWSQPCFDGMVFDIGVSNGQLETPSRGFSYRFDGPLDMRMFSRGDVNAAALSSDETQEEARLLKKTITAYQVVNYFSQEQIADIIYQYGGERLSRKIAAAIIQARKKKPISTTSELAVIVQEAVPAPRWKRGDDEMLRNSAARTFQAIRMHVNDELEQLRSGLRATEHLLHPGGRLLVVTFHSLEDRMVKNFMHRCSGKRSIEDTDRPTSQFSIKRAAHRQHRRADALEFEKPALSEIESSQWAAEPSFELLNRKVVKADEDERGVNPRSRSAKLRGATRTVNEPVMPFGPLV